MVASPLPGESKCSRDEMKWSLVSQRGLNPVGLWNALWSSMCEVTSILFHATLITIDTPPTAVPAAQWLVENR